MWVFERFVVTRLNNSEFNFYQKPVNYGTLVPVLSLIIPSNLSLTNVSSFETLEFG